MVSSATREMPLRTADAARHQLAQRQAGHRQLLLGQHHDQVVAALGVGHRVVGGGVVERPAAGAHRRPRGRAASPRPTPCQGATIFR